MSIPTHWLQGEIATLTEEINWLEERERWEEARSLRLQRGLVEADLFDQMELESAHIEAMENGYAWY